jgi:hypothetical protein
VGFNSACKGLRKKLAKCYIWNTATYWYGAETAETTSEISEKF